VPVNTTIEIVGIKEALRELNKIDKKARRDLTKRFQEVCKPVIQEIISKFPTQAPMSGWKRGWDTRKKIDPSDQSDIAIEVRAAVAKKKRQGGTTGGVLPWDAKPKDVKAGISGKKPRSFRGQTQHLATFFIRWNGPGARLFDISGRASNGQGSGRTMINTLNARYGKASRIMWPALERRMATVEEAVQSIVNDLMEQVNRDTRI